MIRCSFNRDQLDVVHIAIELLKNQYKFGDTNHAKEMRYATYDCLLICEGASL